ncbi:hypothetical protein SPSYN_00576 [Sporotomaculum syntrophicum]|uniref:Uncharacterized protein n=1 Tax=Sporotomaculum syntrophicum TaxID=182264 RepID=A0A9D2WQM8_9FIRM|nr:hypothetical protein [Sporotomaculum syntrophicum]KAF1085847.1 hypothetical protein SPSYN_00576 [Sporotomaculum syntrophicum]
MDEDKMEKILGKILDYQSEHKVDDDNILIMLSLIDLMGIIDVLKREGENSAAGAGLNSGPGNIETLLGPVMALMASGMGKGGATGDGQNTFNPAALLSLLGSGLVGGQIKGSAPDLTALFSLLGPLLGMAGVGKQAHGHTEHGQERGNKPQPVQREINLDNKYKNSASGTVITGEGAGGQKNEQPPKSGEVLKWKFGT